MTEWNHPPGGPKPTLDDVLKKILDRIPIPVVPLHEHGNGRVAV